MPDLLRSGLLENLAGVSIASVIFTTGLVALSLATRSIERPRAFVALGAFASLYGVRLAADIPLAHSLFNGGGWPAYLRDGITYVIPIPVFLLIFELVGSAKDSWYRIAVVIQATYALVAIPLMFRGLSDQAMALNGPLVIAVALLFLPRLLRPLPGDIFEVRPVRVGILIFIAFALHENLAEMGIIATPTELEPIGVLAFLVGVGMSISRRIATTRQRLADVEVELDAARKIQQSILPQSMPSIAGLDVAALQVPATAVGGDLYDFVPLENRTLGILIADVAGHGVPAALIAAMVKMAFVSLRDFSSQPSELLLEMNRVLCGQIERGFVTAGYAWIDLDRNTIRWSRAGHPAAILVHPDGSIATIECGGPVLGRFRNASFPEVELPFPEGSRVVLYTDGVTESRRLDGTPFGEDRLIRIVATGNRSCQELVGNVMRELTEFSNSAEEGFEDDVTIVVARIDAS